MSNRHITCSTLGLVGCLTTAALNEAPAPLAPVATVLCQVTGLPEGVGITQIPYLDAKPILEALRPDLLPPELRTTTPAERESIWHEWVARHDANIRARLEQGDEDSIVNLMLFGTTFTKALRATERDIADAAAGEPIPPAVQQRLDDMVAAIVSPGPSERLLFARRVVERKGIEPETAAGRRDVRRCLEQGLDRVIAEYRTHGRARQAADQLADPAVRSVERATQFRDRGLSTDTSLFSSFALDRALMTLKSKGILGASSVKRVAVIGPGLDFTDKREGYDFYPQQTIQPFALIDSLIRLELAAPDLRMMTLDLSPRVNHHLDTARQAARAGRQQVLHFPRNTEPFRWSPDVVAFWRHVGDKIGEPTAALQPPASAGAVPVRAVRVDPAIVLSILPRDLNIVLQRFDPLPLEQRFDLVVATNVLVYYSVFEQALALANVAALLRPGGLFLSNTASTKLPPLSMDLMGYTDVVYTDRPDGDRVFWCLRQ